MTQKIFIIGAGRSASLIKYLLKESTKNNFELTIGDKDVSLVKIKLMVINALQLFDLMY